MLPQIVGALRKTQAAALIRKARADEGGPTGGCQWSTPSPCPSRAAIPEARILEATVAVPEQNPLL
jgi:hypothetical protein